MKCLYYFGSQFCFSKSKKNYWAAKNTLYKHKKITSSSSEWWFLTWSPLKRNVHKTPFDTLTCIYTQLTMSLQTYQNGWRTIIISELQNKNRSAKAFFNDWTRTFHATRTFIAYEYLHTKQTQNFLFCLFFGLVCLWDRSIRHNFRVTFFLNSSFFAMFLRHLERLLEE